MLAYMIVKGERKLTEHSRKRSLHPVSHPYLAVVAGRRAMAHSSLFITRILRKENTDMGGICHPPCAFHIPGHILQTAIANALA